MDLEAARFNMIEQQIRPWDVLDQRVLDLMMAVPREQFVPALYRNLAFADIQIPLGHGQAMLEPRVEARLLQALNLKPSDQVLEIGTGSAYLTALLAKSVQQVWSLDVIPEFTQAADAKLAALGIDNVTLETANAFQGFKSQVNYDAIVLTGSVPLPPTEFYEQLSVGGRLFAVVGVAPIMEARLITRISAAEWVTESLFETDIPALIGAAQPQRFIF